jgi:tetratricopeptide (TPR) repeat protein
MIAPAPLGTAGSGWFHAPMVDAATVLQSLPDTDWTSVEHAYGPATDIPDLLRALVSDDEATRGKAMWELYGNVIHQHTRYSATAQVIPHLLDLLAAPGVPDKAILLKYLATLIAGPCCVGEGFWIFDGERFSGPQDQLAVAYACYQAALPGIPVLLNLATGPAAALRAAAIYVLGCLRGERHTLVPRLRELGATETAASVRAAIAFATSVLTEQHPEFEGAVRPFHEEDPSALVRVTSAIMLARAGFGDSAVLQTLIEGLQEVGLRRWYRKLPWGSEELLGDIGHALVQIDPELGARAIPALGKALESADRWIGTESASLIQIIGLVWGIRALAFPDGPAPKLSPVQRDATIALIRAKAPWTLTNVFESLREMGLPGTRAANAARFEIDIDGPQEPFIDDVIDEAVVQIEAGEGEAALATLLALTDDDPFVLVNRGRALIQLERHEEAIAALEQTTERFPDFAVGWGILAIAYHQRGRLPDALAASDNAVHFNSDTFEGYYNRAIFRYLTGDVDGALSDARETADRDASMLPQLEAESEIAELVGDPRWESVRAIAR